ncbi:hypothetical protein GCM10019017_67820 [Streptomyces showdoensis]
MWCLRSDTRALAGFITEAWHGPPNARESSGPVAPGFPGTHWDVRGRKLAGQKPCGCSTPQVPYSRSQNDRGLDAPAQRLRSPGEPLVRWVPGTAARNRTNRHA